MSTTHPERTWTGPGAPERLAILRRTRSIAIVGASDKPARASYFVATYLLSSTTYHVYFVNPVLAAAGKEIPDLVEVFRKSSDAPEVVADAARVGARTVWLQLGIWNEDAARQAGAAGLEIVMDRCVKIEHARFPGGLNLAGFVTGVVSSRRQELDR